jgi:succinyl-diaminopimelate desuccinylase
MREPAPVSHRYTELAIEMTRDLIALDTTNPPGNEAAAAHYLAERARDTGLTCEIQPLSDARANIAIEIPDVVGDTRPILMYCGHLDTVSVGTKPWAHPPFSAAIADNRIWGRGSVDMKAGVAAMVAGMAASMDSDVANTCRLRFAGLAGEEVDCCGSRSYLDQGRMDDVDALVVAEPTNLRVGLAHKGALRVEIIVHGQAAHGAMPETGTNAIDFMIAALGAIRDVHTIPAQHALLSAPTLSVNRIDGGLRTNVVPDCCRAELDIRTVPGQSHQTILDRIRAATTQIANASDSLEIDVSMMQSVPAVECPADHSLARGMADALVAATGEPAMFSGMPYFSDASVLSPPRNIPTLMFGPGDETLAHSVNENVEIDQIICATKAFAALPGIV